MNPSTIYNGLLEDFTAAMGITVDSNGDVTGGDWSILTTSPACNASG